MCSAAQGQVHRLHMMALQMVRISHFQTLEVEERKALQVTCSASAVS
jgi:hypothetical protein